MTDVEGIVVKLLYNSSLRVTSISKNNNENMNGGDLMHLIPFTPFNELERLRKDMDDIFRNIDVFERPRVDVFEDEKEVRVVAEIPGISKDDIDITVYDDEVRISGEVKKSSEFKEENIRRSERFYGRFSRIIKLPTEVKSDEARAEYIDGVLTINIPKLAERSTKGKKIRLS